MIVCWGAHACIYASRLKSRLRFVLDIPNRYVQQATVSIGCQILTPPNRSSLDEVETPERKLCTEVLALHRPRVLVVIVENPWRRVAPDQAPRYSSPLPKEDIGMDSMEYHEHARA